MDVSKQPSDFLNGLTAPKVWPRRLLDVNIMKSFERRDGNMYGDRCEPPYSIISYTWGRWHVDEGSRLEVDGIDWKVPALKEAFTVEEFHRVLVKAGERTGGIVWVDIACIDQLDNAVKMDEIGRQAGIFQNAEFAYVWLWTLPATSLKASVDSLRIVPGAGRIQEKIRGCDEVAIMSELLQAVNLILGDWWFSSLWTLQEAFLRSDAQLLSLEGHYINPRPGWRSTNIGSVLNHIWKLLLDLDDKSQKLDDSQANKLGAIIRQRIQDSGYIADPNSDNPNIQYGASRFRKTTNKLDRIYGIMAIYDIRVGAMVPGPERSKQHSLEDLEQEFAATLNSRSPLLAQNFIHLKRPPMGKSWQITQYSRVPWCDFAFTSDGFHELESCTITAMAGASCALITGFVLPLEIAFDYWKAAFCFCKRSRIPNGAVGAHGYTYYDTWNVVLDDYLCDEHSTLPYKRYDYGIDHDNAGQHAFITVTELLALGSFNGRVSIVLLGKESLNTMPSRTFGLLILHEEGARSRCQRIGVCAWETKPAWFSDIIQNMECGEGRWEKYEGVIY